MIFVFTKNPNLHKVLFIFLRRGGGDGMVSVARG